MRILDYEIKSRKINRNSLLSQKQSQGFMVSLTVSYTENFSVQIVCKDFIVSPKHLDIFSILTNSYWHYLQHVQWAKLFSVGVDKSMKGENFALSCDVFAQDTWPLFCTVKCSLQFLSVLLTDNCIVSSLWHHHLLPFSLLLLMKILWLQNFFLISKLWFLSFKQLFSLPRTLPSHHITF